MHSVRLSWFAILIASLALGNVASSQTSTERTAFSFDEIQQEAFRLADVAGEAKDVLLVFDIDNTLLAMNQDLGSDQWFNWQQTLLEGDWRRVGDFQELLRVQSLLYSVGSMRPTEPGRQSDIVQQLQKAGFTMLLLTSRGYDLRDATRRELLANGYDFRQTCLPPQEGFAGPFMPYDPANVEPSGITQEEALSWLADSRNPGQIAEPRLISYNEGVCMVAGQNKGAMLRMLLHKSGNVDRYKHIVFVDDNAENTREVRAAFENQPVNVVTFRYTREDGNVQRFNDDASCAKHCAAVTLMRIRESLDPKNTPKTNPPIWPTEVPVFEPQPAVVSP